MEATQLGEVEFGGQGYPITYDNEAVQIGYRLAKTLGHDDVYAIDADVTLETDAVYERAALEIAGWAEAVRRHEALSGTALAPVIAAGSIGELLRYYNTEGIADHHSLYYVDPALVGAGTDYAGSDFLLKWYERNIRTFANLQCLSLGCERVLMLWGAGHLPILGELIRGCRTLTLADTLGYL